MKRLGIDYGTKRIGLSFADELGVATPLPPLVINQNTDVFEELHHIAKIRGIEECVIGYPINMDDSIGKRAKDVDTFIESLKKKINVPIHKVDERLTTVQAVSDLATMRISKKKKTIEQRKKQRKSGQVDSVAATLMLQEFLDEKGDLNAF